MRSIAVLLLAAGLGMAGPKGEVHDVTHPRSPGTPLEVKFAPWYCPRCVKEERIEPQERKIRMWRMPVEELAKILDLDKKWLVIETPNFKILSTLGRANVKFKDVQYARADLLRLKTIFPKLGLGREGTTVNAHQRAHLYHIRVERLYSHFAALTDNKKKFLGMDAPYEIYLLDDYAEYSTLTDQFIGRGMRMAGIQHHSKEKPNFNCFPTSEQQYGRTKGRGDRGFSNWVTHNVAHLLVDGFHNYYRETWGWLEEGLAHYYERKEYTNRNTFCWTEGKPPQDFLKPDWESVIYNLVRRGKDPSLSQWCEKLMPGELTGVENGLSWSIVRWLVETEPIRFTKLLRKLNDYENKPTAAQSIEYAFGVSPGVLHSRWREYVRENYGKKK
ncbi:MAG: hypothetical protein ACYSUM_14200 [Planctomycetota bacterium]|jgi:hypothetical protein